MEKSLVRLIRYFLQKFGLEIKKIGNPINLWDDDHQFNAIFDRIKDLTLVDKKRCFILYQLIKQISTVPGDIAEIGVYQGGTARLLAETRPDDPKMLYLFDTFTGMPTTDAILDLHKEGHFNNTSFEEVSSFLNDCKNIRIYAGKFPDTAKPIVNTSFSLVHIDVDIYKSVVDCCHFFYPRMNTRGIMVFDDYGFVSCPGAKKAVDEFFALKPENPCYLPTGQCVVWKL